MSSATPQPPQANSFFGVKVSKAGIPVQGATDNQLIYKDNFSTKTFFDDFNPRMLEGLLPDGNYGLWVSPPGIDVTTANNQQLIFNSNQDTLKIVAVTSVVISSDGSTQNVITLAHNLDFVPAAVGYLVNVSVPGQVQDGAVPLPTFLNAQINAVAYPGIVAFTSWIYLQADATNVYIVLLNGTGGVIANHQVVILLLEQSVPG